MGVVYEALDTERDAVVALKTLHGMSPDSIYALKREFRALADVSHPTLVQLYELFSEDDRWFFTMELVRGADLLTYVQATAAEPDAGVSAGDETVDRARPGTDTVRSIFAQLASGVRALHAAGRLHRDIKPSNAMVTGEGRVVLLDFGLARELSSDQIYESVEQGMIGTPAYMAPEQAFGGEVTEASDWYAVGVILYEALTGRLPFEGSVRDILIGKHQEDAPSPRALAPDAPDRLLVLVEGLLRRDPLARPTGQAVLAELIGTGAALRPEPAPAPKETTTLLGRDQELKKLEDALETVRGGQATTCLVHGSLGAGTTALIQQFIARVMAADPTLVALKGRCFERELVPFRVLDSAIDSLCRFMSKLPAAEVEALLPRDIEALTRVFPVMRRVRAIAAAPTRVRAGADPKEVRRRAFNALRELVARLADRRPLIVCIDGMQWADPDGAALLAHMLRPPDGPIALLVLGYRTEDAASAPVLAGLLDTLQSAKTPAVDVPIEALDPAQTRLLAEQLLGDEKALPEVLDALVGESGGNPALVGDIVAFLKAWPGLAATPAGVEQVRLDRVLEARLETLDADSKRLLGVVAIAGGPIRTTVATRAAALGTHGHAAIEALRASGLIRATGSRDQVVLAHEGLRDTLVGQTDVATRHRDLAVALEVLDDVDPEIIAYHLERAGLEKRSAVYLVAAADRAVSGLAFNRAAGLFTRAIALTEDETARTALVIKLGEALSASGRGSEAARAFLDAVAGSTESEGLELTRRAAEQYLRAGHVDKGLESLDRVLEDVHMRLAETPGRALASLLWRRFQLKVRGLGFIARPAEQITDDERRRLDACWTVTVGLGVIDNIRAADFQTRHLLYALGSGDTSRICRAVASEAGFSSTQGTPNTARTAMLLNRAQTMAGESGDEYLQAYGLVIAGIAAYMEGRWAAALRLCREAEAALLENCSGVAWELGSARMTALWSLAYLGEMSELSRRVPELVRDAHDRGDMYVSTSVQTGLPNLVWLVRDKPERARAELENAIKRWSRRGFHTQHYWDLLAETQIDLYRGEGMTALKRLDETWRPLKRSALLRVQTVRVESLYLRGRAAIRAAMADKSQSTALLGRAKADASKLGRERAAWASALATLLTGCVNAAEGRTSEAVARLETAALQCEATSMVLYARVADRARGRLLGGDEGRALVTATDDWLRDQTIRDPERFAAMLAP